MSTVRHTRLACVSFVILLLNSLTLLLLPATSEGAPAITWTSAHVSQVFAQGETVNIPVSFQAGKALTDMTFRVVPELAPYVSVTPASIASVPKDDLVFATLSFAPADDAPLGAFDGTVQLQSTSAPKETYAKPLPVELAIGVFLNDNQKSKGVV